ncbi:MAG TPA: NUDIX domain-containing protein [Candidatus Saccharimonadales bacterium]|nr:NUDIX domain-containing protein [Candidatus Saccharimonadales bacterium]
MNLQIGQDRPKVGVGLLLIKDDSLVLFGKRKNAHGDGEYAGIGGHMEGLETFAETIMRELREEVGDEIQITEPKFLCLSNIRKYAPKHYIDIGMIAHWVSGDPKVMEPDKIESWEWYPLDTAPSPLFESPANYLQAYKAGQTFFE